MFLPQADDDDILGQDLLADVPRDDDGDDDWRPMVFECSEHTPIPCYRLSVLEHEG